MLSMGQLNDAFAAALGRAPTSAEIQQYGSDPSLEGDAGKFALIAKLGGGGGATGGASSTDPMALVRQAQQFQVEQNQPAIQTLQKQSQTLPDQYSALLAEIKGAGSAATNYGIMGANENLAARGITPNSALYNTTVAGAIAPIGLQYGGLEAQLGQGSVQTLTDLAGSIAALQAGNVPSAQNFGANISSLQNALAIARLQGTQRPFTPVSPGQALGNVTTGQIAIPTFSNTGILR